MEGQLKVLGLHQTKSVNRHFIDMGSGSHVHESCISVFLFTADSVPGSFLKALLNAIRDSPVTHIQACSMQNAVSTAVSIASAM